MSRAGSLAGAGAPVLGLHGGLDGLDVLTTAAPGGLVTLGTLNSEAHFVGFSEILLKGMERKILIIGQTKIHN